ncbi:peptidase [Enterococcus termitis]|uniref:Peptidase n=2 Tax=Enterococcus termitis TaxID=332950 RepID=A0A1E5GKC2_9ENTE|nr:peptidase [Enterococcus termitis]
MKKILAGVVVTGQIVVSSIVPLVAHANILFPEKVTIEYDSNQLYTMNGTFSNGEAYSRKDPPLFAVYAGARQPVFCYEPKATIDSTVTSGYTSNPLPNIVNQPRAKYISVLWKYAGADADTQIVAQSLFWQEVNGLTITSIVRPDGTPLSNYQSIKDKINKVVDDYMKKPSFSGQTVKVNLGETVTLTDTDNVGLERFDGRFQNTANVDWSISGNKLTITPKKDSNTSGVLRIAKTLDTGTPVAYKLQGQQSVMAGAIDDPNSFDLKIEIVKTGEVKIVKLDKETGKVVPNTEFKVEYNGQSQMVKTNDKGEAIVKDIFHDTKVKVTETFVPAPYILDTNNTKEVVVQAGKTASVEFKNERATGKTTLTKQDATTESNEPLNPAYPMTGAKYGLFKKDGTLLKEFTLDEKLTATMDKIELGSYYWAETLAPVGYTLDQTKHVVELTYKDQYTPVIVKGAGSNDDVIRMNVDGQKLIQNETNEMFKNDVEFTLTNKRTEETHIVTTATVDGKKGYFRFADIALDDYVLTETKGVEGYKNVDPIEITHSYDKETDTFTFVVKDQKSGNVLNEEKITQLELSKGYNVDLGTYTLKDKAIVVETPEVGISTKAHIGDGESNTFVWGEEATFYDDSILTHKNIEIGTKRAKEVKLYAVYTDKEGEKTTGVVWSSGLIDYEVSDKEMTERVIAAYDYRKDEKADENTRWFFGEDGYNYDEEKPKKDTEHNPDGKDPKQDITPVVIDTPKVVPPKKVPPKETPKEVPKETPKKTPKETPKPTEKASLPYTGEDVKQIVPVVGLALVIGVVGAMYLRRKKSKETDATQEDK